MKQRLLIIAGVAAVLAIGILVFFTTVFRLTSAEPTDKASSIAPVIFTFNKAIDSKTAKEFSISPYVPGNVYIEDKTVTFKPSQSYKLEQRYTAELKAVYATSGSKLGPQRTSFLVTFIPENELSESEKAAHKNATDSIEDHPFLSKLPYETLDFKVDYEPVKDPDGNPTFIVKVTLYGILNNPSQKAEYDQQLRDNKRKATAWMESKGLDRSKIYVQYNPDPDPDPNQYDRE